MPAFPAASSSVRASHRRGAARPIPDATLFDIRSNRRGIELVNPGSVGMPFDTDPRAAYAIVHDDRRVEQRRVPYDHEASAAAVRERFDGAPWTATVAARIERARFDV